MCTKTIVDYIADDDISEDDAERSIRLLSAVPGFAAVCLLLGTVVTCAATRNWEKSGAADAVAVVECRLGYQYGIPGGRLPGDGRG